MKICVAQKNRQDAYLISIEILVLSVLHKSMSRSVTYPITWALYPARTALPGHLSSLKRFHCPHENQGPLLASYPLSHREECSG